jgi:DNA-binding CsgD family transcriptional regulator
MAQVRKHDFHADAGVDDAGPRPLSLRVVETPPLPEPEVPSLTPRERQCLGWCSEGKSYWETAVILGISERTVSFHMEAVRSKLNAASNAHAVAVALRAGLLEPAPRDLR